MKFLYSSGESAKRASKSKSETAFAERYIVMLAAWIALPKYARSFFGPGLTGFFASAVAAFLVGSLAVIGVEGVGSTAIEMGIDSEGLLLCKSFILLSLVGAAYNSRLPSTSRFPIIRMLSAVLCEYHFAIRYDGGRISCCQSHPITDATAFRLSRCFLKSH